MVVLQINTGMAQVACLTALTHQPAALKQEEHGIRQLNIARCQEPPIVPQANTGMELLV